jgi:hypothetical protein
MYSGTGVKETTHLHLKLRLRIGGAKPPVPLYVFAVWTRKTLFYFIRNYTEDKWNTAIW